MVTVSCLVIYVALLLVFRAPMTSLHESCFCACLLACLPLSPADAFVHGSRDEPTDEITNGASSLWWRDVVLDFAVIRPRDLPAGVHYGVTFTSFCINTPRYLKYLLNAFTDAGGTVLRRELSVDKGFSAALAAAEDVVSGEGGGGEAHAFVNATGLGARLLLGEDKMFPTRGQTVLVRGEAEVARTRVGTGYITYCIPRPGSGTTILGGTKEVGDW